MTETRKTYTFRAGRTEIVYLPSDVDLIGWAESIDCDLFTPGKGIVARRTEIVVSAYQRKRPSRTRRVGHILSHLERKVPHIIFVASISHDEYLAKCAQADEARERRETVIQNEIQARMSDYSRTVLFDELPDKWKKRIRKKECWYWLANDCRTYSVGPYRSIFKYTKGEIPKNAVLRHSCDKRSCVNPNHLFPGTHDENMDDMVQRQRTARRRIA